MREENKLFSKLLPLAELYQLYIQTGVSINNDIDLGGFSYDKNALANSVELLKILDLIIEENNVLCRNMAFGEAIFREELVKRIFETYGIEIRTELIKKMHYNTECKALEIYKNAIPLRYAGLFMVLFDVEEISDIDNKWLLVGKNINNVFLADKQKHPISLEKLKEKLIQESVWGEEAEQFVIEYEKRKLRERRINKEPFQVSTVDVSAGFDILSYDKNEDDEMFIEVKSCKNDYRFHFSTNEINTARIYGTKYWLYLFNRMNATIMEIQNPYSLLFEENSLEWAKEPDGYVIHRL